MPFALWAHVRNGDRETFTSSCVAPSCFARLLDVGASQRGGIFGADPFRQGRGYHVAPREPACQMDFRLLSDGNFASSGDQRLSHRSLVTGGGHRAGSGWPAIKSLWDEPWHCETSLSASILGSRMDSPNAHDHRLLAPLDNSIGSPSMIFTLSTDQ